MKETEILNRCDFFTFVSDEFDKVVVHAPIEDLAAFAFGSVEEAVRCFKNNNKRDGHI